MQLKIQMEDAEWDVEYCDDTVQSLFIPFCFSNYGWCTISFATTYYEVECSGYVQTIFWPHSCFLAIGTSVPESHICTRKKNPTQTTPKNPASQLLSCFVPVLLYFHDSNVNLWKRDALFSIYTVSIYPRFLVRKKKSADYTSKRRESKAYPAKMEDNFRFNRLILCHLWRS